MARLFLVRHGRADAAGAVYDRLTDTGRRQAELLAEYLHGTGLRAERIFSGTMERQRHTASYLAEKFDLPVETAPGLDEFLPGFWKSTAEAIAQNDQEFARGLEKYRTLPRGEFRSLALFLRHTERIMHEWRSGLTAEGCESFEDFRTRVLGILDHAKSYNGNVFLFSSGTPIALMITTLLGMEEGRFFDWMRILFNTSLSVFSSERGRFLPVTVNSLPHLLDRSLHTLL